VSVQEERELREGLAGLLAGVEPRPAPLARTMRQGRGIRTRRWVAAAAGLAILAAGVAAVPVALHAHAPAPSAPRRYHYTETINPPGPHAAAGLISSGTQDGHRWQIVLSGHGTAMSVGGTGHVYQGSGFTSPTDPADFTSAGGGGRGGSMMLAGPVQSDVTRVTVGLPGGRILALTPVRYGRLRYVGVVIPYGLPIVRAVAYDGSRELAYSVPYGQAIFAAWWRPGQTGPPRFTQTIASGVTNGHAWRYVARFGPWGYCYTLPAGSACGAVPQTPPASGQPITQITCGGLYDSTSADAPLTGLVVARPDVRQVAVALSDGSAERYRTADVRGTWMFAVVLPHGPRVTGTTEYGQAGQVVGGASAAALGACR
jgi:hypothetical protein